MANKLINNSLIYILGELLNKSVPFFLLPILTRYLTPADYGIISIFTVVTAIFAVFVGLSIHGAIGINFFKLDKDDFKIFVGNCILILNITASITLIIVIFSSSLIFDYTKINIEWLILSIFLAFSQFITMINLVLWQSEQNPKLYTIYQLTQTIVVATVSLTMVIGFSLGWQGQVIATAIGGISFGLISFIFIIKRGYFLLKPDKKHIKDALKFGIPLIPHALSGWLKTGMDRIIVFSVLGSDTTGIYSVTYQLGLGVAILTASFNKAWSPYLNKILSDNPSIVEEKILVKYTYWYFIAILLIALIGGYFIQLLVPFLLGEKFIKAAEYITMINISFAFQGMYFMVVNYIFYEKKTYILAYVTFFSSVLHVTLVYYSIERYGLQGVVFSTVISYFITFLAVWVLSARVRPMPWLYINK